ncbi:hypothetical protein PPSIR1_06156 [Plesiocystis pacifica SIR-1]|uniref:Uncharacterized protein n=1 Tax=Plesiocystis pacifica SIR-1 TaxID=391625 RepID=A6G6V6_9BACT|nr:hypothetical protein PPSIR1_11030 [Plesiocystis pacifica SIR-1]EDM78409.1 hypothetical protein PPSIR1_06156 [Plesiocystis pacifica SIR-1]
MVRCLDNDPMVGKGRDLVWRGR